MIQLSDLTKTFGDRVLFDHVTWQITDRERVGLCGPNGAGKTTLLKMMAGLDEPDGGAILKPSALTVGYLPQDGLNHAGRSVFDEASSAFGELLAMKTEMHALEGRLGDESIPEAEHDAMLHRYSDLQDRFRVHDGYSIELKTATVLQGLGFKATDFERPTETFSGGWQMRIALAKLLLGEPNLLLLDEPTNHLDLEARNWLEEYLNAYPYAVILVSHDRFFLDKIATQILAFDDAGVDVFNGNYTEYHDWRDQRDADRLRQGDAETARKEEGVKASRGETEKNEGSAGAVTSSSSNLSKNQRERLEKRIADIEKGIAVLEGEVAELTAKMSLPEVVADYSSFQEVSGIAEAKQAKIQSLYEEWEAASAEL